jgi:exodeoxyribonuclease-5
LTSFVKYVIIFKGDKNMIVLTVQQENAIKEVKKMLSQKKPLITIAGFAGTGKTTLVQYLIESLGYTLDDVAFACFTGKASLVLQQKGIPATTLHSLLYISFMNKEGEFVHIKKKELDYPFKLIIIDEISMVSNDILMVARSHKIPIIALGDVGQLPPIGETNGLLNHPDIVLTEILRQEADNPIIQLSMDIRTGKKLSLTKNENVMIIDRSDLVEGMFLWADQILCGYNNTRNEINSIIRKILGYQNSIPEKGEKIICTKNYWNTLSQKLNLPLVNGTIGFIEKIHNSTNKNQTIDFKPDYVDDLFDKLTVNTALYKQETPKEEWVYRAGRRMPITKDMKIFDWAYAITTHRFQGSQANNILLFEEKLNAETHKQWLYTAVTRSAQKIIIVRS